MAVIVIEGKVKDEFKDFEEFKNESITITSYWCQSSLPALKSLFRSLFLEFRTNGPGLS